MSERTAIETLAETYPQLYLDPGREEKEAYRKVVLQGETPESRDLSHFKGDPQDQSEIVETPAGPVVVVSLRNRADYEVFVRCMMAAKEGPKAPIPASQGASTLVAFNWPRIYAHKRQFMEEQHAAGVEDPDWSGEFRRFISVPANYQDPGKLSGPAGGAVLGTVQQCQRGRGRTGGGNLAGDLLCDPEIP